MKPTASPVASASGTLASGASVVENRISETIGASAAPKKAVLRCDAHRLAAKAGVEGDARDDRPDVEQVLAEQAEAEHEEQAGDGRAGHLRPGAPIDERRGERRAARR